jgi:DNA polymerase
MASAIYSKSTEEITSEERFVGKTTILGAGYGMGAQKFRAQLKTFGAEVSEDDARHIISVYRQTYPFVTSLWREAQMALEALSKGYTTSLGKKGVLTLVPSERGIRLPSGLLMRYDQLIATRDEKGMQYQYKTRYGWNKIYGGKVIENVCQAIARCIIGEQMVKIAKRYDVVLTVHDAIACVVKDEEVLEAQAYIEECMKWTPEWAEGLPVNCESGYGKSYGDC